MERAIKAAFWITMATLLNTTSGIIFWALVASRGGKLELGQTAFEVSMSYTVATLLNLGLYQYTLRFIPSLGKRAYATALSAAILLGALGASALLLAGFKWAPLIVISSLLNYASMGALIATWAAKAYFAATSLSIAKLLLLPLLSPTAAFAIASLLSSLYATIESIRKVGISRPGEFGEFLKAALSNYLLNFSTSFAISLGTTIAGSLGNIAEAGLIYLISMAVTATASLSAALASTAVPAMVKDGVAISYGAMRLALGLTVPSAVAAGSLSPILMQLLGGEYVNDYPALAAATPAIVMQTAIQFSTSIYNVEKKWIQITEIGLVATVSILLSIIFLAPINAVGPGLVLTTSLLPATLLSLRVLPAFHFITGLAIVATLVPVEIFLGPTSLPVTIIISLILLHFTNIYKLDEYIKLVKLLKTL